MELLNNLFPLAVSGTYIRRLDFFFRHVNRAAVAEHEQVEQERSALVPDVGCSEVVVDTFERIVD